MQFTGQMSVGSVSFPVKAGLDRGIRYGRPPEETQGIKRKGIDGRAHKEWNLRLIELGRVGWGRSDR